MCSVYVSDELSGIKTKYRCLYVNTEFNFPLLLFCLFKSFTDMSTFWESVCWGCSSSRFEATMLVLDVGLVGSLEGLASPSGLLHTGISCEECGLLDSSSSEVKLWSLMLSVISCSFCLSCCSSRSTSSHWGRGEVLFGVRGAWLVCRNRAEITSWKNELCHQWKSTLWILNYLTVSPMGIIREV